MVNFDKYNQSYEKLKHYVLVFNINGVAFNRT